MIVTVFRSRLRPEHADEYFATAARMSELACAMPGYVSHKVFTAADGERVTIVEFESAATHRAWAADAAHAAAKQAGRGRFYSEYSIQVCEVLRSNSFSREA